MANRRSWKGCLFGCLGVAIGLMVLLGTLSYLLVKKGTYEAPATMLFPDTDFFVHSEIKREDEQVLDFLVTQVGRMNQEQMSQFQKNIPFLGQDFQTKKTRKDIRKMLPIQVELSGDLAEEDLIISVGFSIYNNMARLGFWFLKRAVQKDENGIYREVNGKTYLKPEASDKYFLALENSVFYLAKTEESMQRALNPGEEAVTREEVHPLLGQVNQESIFWGVARGPSLAKLFDSMLEEGSEPFPSTESGVRMGSSDFRAMAFDVDPISTEAMQVRLFCDVSPLDNAAVQAFETFLEQWSAKTKVTVERQIEQTPDGLLVTLTVSNLERLSLEKEF